MKNTLLFTCSTNILVSLLTVNMKNCLTPKIRKCATILVTLLKMRPIQRHIPISLLWESTPPPPPVEERANRFQKHPLNGHRLARKPHRKEETHNSSKVSRFLSVNPYIRRLQKQSFFSYTNPYIYSTQQCRWSYFELGHGLPVG